MNVSELLSALQTACQRILGDNLTGIYIHGSLAFGCFRWGSSDIDLIVVVEHALTLSEKEALIAALLKLDAHCPPKGLELSVVLSANCSPFVYPTPFELHYSNLHKAAFRRSLTETCRAMQGTDIDLAAHFTVIRAVGTVLCGKPVAEVFAEVPKSCYYDSIRMDLSDTDILQNPVYYVLNACRACAYLHEGHILSKEQGGIWGLAQLPAAFSPLIQQALAHYRSGKQFAAPQIQLHAFAAYIREQLDSY